MEGLEDDCVLEETERVCCTRAFGTGTMLDLAILNTLNTIKNLIVAASGRLVPCCSTTVQPSRVDRLPACLGQ